MSELTTFRSIIELWPKREQLGAEIGIAATSVSKWWQRDSIPAEWWASLLSLPKAREAGLTAEFLADLAARRDRVEVA